jgi:hypothetical protein
MIFPNQPTTTGTKSCSLVIKKGKSRIFLAVSPICYYGEILIFFLLKPTAHKVTITIAAATETNISLLNSGTVGLGNVVGDEVGFVDADELAESDKIESALL